MSSPMINNVVILGCFFCYVFVFLLGIHSRFVDDKFFGILCNVSRLFNFFIIVFQNGYHGDLTSSKEITSSSRIDSSVQRLIIWGIYIYSCLQTFKTIDFNNNY